MPSPIRRPALQHQGLGDNCTYTTRPEQLRDGTKKVDGEDEEFAHGANGTITAGACNTTRRRQIASHNEFATDS